jgi:hypothetical protein
MALVGFKAPALPLPTPQYDVRQQNELNRALRLYFNRIDSFAPNQAESYTANEFIGGSFTGGDVKATSITGFGRGLELPYAMLMSDADQTSAGTTSENLLTYNQVVLSNGVRVLNNSQIHFTYPGQYLITFTLQVTNRGNTAAEFEVWAKNTGVNYPLSNTRFDIPQRKSSGVWSHIVPAITGIFTVNNNEYLEIAWWSDSLDVYIEHYAAGTSPTRPEIPSVILTVSWVSALPPQFALPFAGSLTLTGAAPVVVRNTIITPPVGALAIAGAAPTVTIA